MKTYHFIVKGKVQGVGYRGFTFLIAKSHRLKGNVKNLPDGDVEIFVQGEEKTINNFKKYLKKGPLFSKVTEIIEEIITTEEVYKKFVAQY
ncbi:MAG: acylphosphatase [Fusobacteriaceae bacterium]